MHIVTSYYNKKYIYAGILSWLFYSCNPVDEGNPVNEAISEITITSNKIECKKCSYFGSFIETEGEDLIIGGSGGIYFFEETTQGFISIGRIGFDQTSGIQSMLLKDRHLYLGIAMRDGTGKVYIYNKVNGNWEKLQELEIGRSQDSFGSSIDVSGDFLVIGANAPWVDGYDDFITNKDEGRIYVYKKTSSGWVMEAEFLSEETHGDDRFGGTITIHGRYIVAGPLLHIYEKNEEWELKSVDQYYVSKIVHNDNHLLIKGGDNALYDAILDENGEFEFYEISIDWPDFEVSGHGEIIEINGQTALVDSEHYGTCLVMEFENDKWEVALDIKPFEDEYCDFFGLAISDQYVFVGGDGFVYNIQY